ncbi:MAG: DUF3795 domain-containing protein [Anaerolineae bacterium]|nr:DUF3795 domain-containing protein [Anaerolineae bacterium]
MAERIVAYCGLICTNCPAYVATQNDDMAALAQVAEQWSKEFGAVLTAQDCICDGCIGEGRKIGHCSECGVRLCAVERGVTNCAHCTEYEGCETLDGFLKFVPDARAILEQIRLSL